MRGRVRRGERSGIREGGTVRRDGESRMRDRGREGDRVKGGR